MIRKADLTNRTVTTLAGDGQQAREFNQGGSGLETALNSPWDVVLKGNSLFIAMAGPHQIWVMDLESGQLEPFAGSGQEGLLDGPLRKASLAQPSGLVIDGTQLFFADSETSSIRVADIKPGGQVRTLVGQDLFVFGDVDGKGETVRLQHPLGVTSHNGQIYIADTYNNKIKILDPQTRQCTTFAGKREAGFLDGANPLFDEPSGLVVWENNLYVADTNNHRIRIIDLDTGETRTLVVRE
jgi:DNA-binding beta-propeller fold protein YncE